MEPAGNPGEGYGDRVALELARLREAVDDLRRRPPSLDAETLRHVINASLSEASTPPPNLLVTAIRRLDRLDARLQSIEAALSGQPALASGPPARARATPANLAAHPSPPLPPLDVEALAEALARRLGSTVPHPAGGGATPGDLVAAVRPLVPGAARNVLRRGGREPSPQAVDVLQQAALAALEEAVGALAGRRIAPTPEAWDPRAFAPPPLALVPAVSTALPAPKAPSPPQAPPPPPLDVEALAATIAVRVTAEVSASVARQLTVPSPPPAPVPDPTPPPPPSALDPAQVADAVVARLAEAPAPQAVLSPLAMAPLLSAVGNVESAVARLEDPSADIVGAVTRLEAGIDALAAALEGDRAAQSEELQRGLEVLAAQARRLALSRAPTASNQSADEQPFEAGPSDRFELDRSEPDERSVLALHDRLDQVHRQLATLVDVDADLGAALPRLADQGRRLERSIGDILLGLATMADHLGGKVVDDVEATAADDLLAFRPEAPDDGSPPAGLGQVAAQLDALVAAARADRQRFQRLGGSIDGLAELLGMVTERLDRLGQLPGGRDRWIRASLVDDNRAPPPTSVGGGDPTGEADPDDSEPQAVISGPDASVLAAMAEARHDAVTADKHEDAVADRDGGSVPDQAGDAVTDRDEDAHRDGGSVPVRDEDAIADRDEDAASSEVPGLDVTGPPKQGGAAPDPASTPPHQLPDEAPALDAADRAGPDAVGLRRRRRRRRRRARRNPGR